MKAYGNSKSNFSSMQYSTVHLMRSLFFFLCLSISINSQAQLNKFLNLQYNSTDIADPVCSRECPLCVQYGKEDSMAIFLESSEKYKLKDLAVQKLRVNFIQGVNVLWTSPEMDSVEIDEESGLIVIPLITQLDDPEYPVVLGSALIQIEYFGPISKKADPESGQISSSAWQTFGSKRVCFQRDCQLDDVPLDCVCGNTCWSVGVMAGIHYPIFGGSTETPTPDLNLENKFAGVAAIFRGKRLIYQGELQVGQLNMTLDTQVNGNGTVTQQYSFIQIRAVPVHLRIPFQKWGSLGFGTGLSFLAISERDQEEIVTFSEVKDNSYQRWEPFVFGDLRFGNPIKGINFGLRYQMNFGGIQNITDNPYQVPSAYLQYTF
ncbi:MAG: hypothetical protein AAF388_02325 [Bacteroidota bacterium]